MYSLIDCQWCVCNSRLVYTQYRYAVSTLYKENTRPISNLGNVRFDQASIRFLVIQAQHLRKPEAIGTVREQIHAVLNDLNKTWGLYYPNEVGSSEEEALVAKLVPLLKEFNALVLEASRVLADNDFDQVDRVVGKLMPVGEAIDKLLTEDTELNLDLAQSVADKGEDTASALIGTAIALAAAGFLIGIAAIIYLVRAITRPLGKALNVANNIAEGKLENTVVVDRKDEFGQLLGSLKRMDTQLAGIVREIKVSTESVTVASRQIASGNLDSSARTEEQAASLEETAASMTQLTETVKQNADNVHQADTMAADARAMAEAGDASVQAMINTVGKLSDSSSKVSEITGLIEGIAFQTNILALNAAVEAARAGEQGRGFAVVASEVRTLAQRSSAAAKEIKVLIDASVTMAKDDTRQAEDVGVTMSKVKLGIKHVSDIVNEISKASAEQSQGIEQVHHAIAQMDDVTQQNAALVEEAAAAAQSLEEQADKLKDSVSVFRVRDREVLDNVPVSLGSHS